MKRYVSPVLMLLLVLVGAMAGCKDFIEGKEIATVGDAVEIEEEPAEAPDAAETEGETPETPDATTTPEATEPAEAPATDAKVFTITENTAIMFEGSKTIGTHTGGFTKFDGKITLKGDDPTQAKIDITIDMESMFSDDNLLTTVLRGEDFFSIEQHPTARFVSTKIEPKESGLAITGNLELKGVTKSVTFTAKPTITEDTINATAEFVVDRSAWDVGYADWKGEIIRDEVLIALDVEAKLEKD